MTTVYGYETKRWNPVVGCKPISEGCEHCWARLYAKRLGANPRMPRDARRAYGTVSEWDGATRLIESRLDEPARLKKPQVVATCFMGDLGLAGQWIGTVRRAACEPHTYLYLTKRPASFARYFNLYSVEPHPREWFGVSVENQARADERIPDLLKIEGNRWLSAEPLLGPLDLSPWIGGLGWVVAGPETGRGARPCDPAWIESLRRQCRDAGIPFFDKRPGGSKEVPW